MPEKRTITIEIDPEDIPRSMEGEELRIVSSYTEAGWYSEANAVRITDGERTAVYVPWKKAERRD